MRTTGKCPKCGSTEIIADAKAIDRDQVASQKYVEYFHRNYNGRRGSTALAQQRQIGGRCCRAALESVFELFSSSKI